MCFEEHNPICFPANNPSFHVPVFILDDQVGGAANNLPYVRSLEGPGQFSELKESNLKVSHVDFGDRAPNNSKCCLEEKSKKLQSYLAF